MAYKSKGIQNQKARERRYGAPVWLRQAAMNARTSVKEHAKRFAPASAALGFSGMCAWASAAVVMQCAFVGHKAETWFNAIDGSTENGLHVFVHCEGWLVDVTATQFGRVPVVILPWDMAIMSPPWLNPQPIDLESLKTLTARWHGHGAVTQRQINIIKRAQAGDQSPWRGKNANKGKNESEHDARQ